MGIRLRNAYIKGPLLIGVNRWIKNLSYELKQERFLNPR